MPGTDFYIYQLPEGVKMREILAHDIRMQTRVDIFWILKMFVELGGSKVQLAPLLAISSMASQTPKSSLDLSLLQAC